VEQKQVDCPMLKMKKMAKLMVKDPVWSNLCANIIVALVAYFFMKMTTHPEYFHFTPLGASAMAAGHPSNHYQSFHTANGHIVIYWVMGSLILVFLFCLYRMIKGLMSKYPSLKIRL
jgi:hypothetical protein